MQNKPALVAFYIGNGLLMNKAIRAYQRFKGMEHWQCSHVELFIDYDERIDAWKAASSSGMDGGVRVKHIRSSANWVTIPRMIDREYVDGWLLENLGRKAFDWRGIFGYVAPFIHQDIDRLYCEEAVDEMAKTGAGSMSPAQYFKYLINLQNETGP